MKLIKTIPLEGDKLSAKELAMLGVGESLTAFCESLADKDNARSNAYYVCKNIPRPDGNTYKIETSNLFDSVTVTVVPPTDDKTCKTKKLIHGTQSGLDKGIKRHEANGWAVERTEKAPRGIANTRFTYIAYLKREI